MHHSFIATFQPKIKLFFLCILLTLVPYFSFAQVETNLSAGGGVKIGDSATACSSSISGAIRYDADGTNGFGYCNGSNWQDFALSSIPAIADGGDSLGATLTIGTNDNNDLAFETNNTTHMVVTTSGNVGIGTTSPEKMLTIVTTGSDTTDFLITTEAGFACDSELYNDANVYPAYSLKKGRGTAASTTIVNSGDSLGFISFYGYDGSAFDEAARVSAEVDGTPGSGDMPGRLRFFTTSDATTNLTERMRITSAGYVGIANTSPSAEVDVTGDIEYTGVITDVSDRRLKEEIKPLSNSLDLISRIEGVSFVMKDDPKKRVEFGVIAQQLEAVIPELVHTADDEMQSKSANYVGLIGFNIEAIKELDGQQNSNQQDLKNIEGKILDLKKRLKALRN